MRECIFQMYVCCNIQVLMKDIMTPVPAEEVRAVIKKCLENAALINYNKLASEAKVEGEFHHQSLLLILLWRF